jgi:hypothetical protein
MSMCSQTRHYYDPVQTQRGPMLGDIIKDCYGMRIKVFDGTEWQEIAEETIQDMEIEHLHAMLEGLRRDKEMISDSYLEKQYEDLKLLREEQEREYDRLRDKYKVFEILKASGATHA